MIRYDVYMKKVFEITFSCSICIVVVIVVIVFVVVLPSFTHRVRWVSNHRQPPEQTHSQWRLFVHFRRE